MKPLKLITTLLLITFWWQQSIAAAKIEQEVLSIAYVKNANNGIDSTGKDITSENNPKEALKKFLKTALKGDEITGARLNPAAVSFVENYIARHKKNYLAMREKYEPHLTMMDQVLIQHGIPVELKYLAVIESHLKSGIVSHAGAVGPWQFMPATARNYGLYVGRYRDERTDYFKSTHAAARMLTDLFSEFGDWLLVIAAYNGGSGNVHKAIRKSGGSKDFWVLQNYLPVESMNHVKKFIATHYIFEGEGGITTLTKQETKELLSNASNLSAAEISQTESYNITGRFHSAVITKYIEMEKREFDRYNPNFDNEIALNGKYNLRLPRQKMNTFIAFRYEILDESMKYLLNTSTTANQ